MKLIEIIFYAAYKISLLFIAFILLLGIILIAEKNSWYYLLLYVPVILWNYTGVTGDKRNKQVKLLRKKIMDGSKNFSDSFGDQMKS